MAKVSGYIGESTEEIGQLVKVLQVCWRMYGELSPIGQCLELHWRVSIHELVKFRGSFTSCHEIHFYKRYIRTKVTELYRTI